MSSKRKEKTREKHSESFLYETQQKQQQQMVKHVFRLLNTQQKKFYGNYSQQREKGRR